MATPPVRYPNRDASSTVHAASLPGVSFCGAFLSGAGDYPELGELPITVSVDVVGTAGDGAPEYSDGGFPWWGWLIVVLGAVAVLLVRRTPRKS